MYKRQFIKAAAEKAGMTERDMNKALNALLEVITEALAESDRVQVTGFGTFDVSERAARDGRNPATGKKIRIPARTVPTFRVGSKLKKAVEEVIEPTKPPETTPKPATAVPA